MSFKRPYEIAILNHSNLHIAFNRVVPADSFFAYCEEIQNCSKNGIFKNQKIETVYFDFSKTVWFDTLAACYLLMFAEQAKMNTITKSIRFYFSDYHDRESVVDSPDNYASFHAFLHDNGFLTQMRRIGAVENMETVSEIQYSSIHKCIWPLQVFHDGSEIGESIELIKKQLRNELAHELNSYELEYLIGKVSYFLQETLDNTYKHGYDNHAEIKPCTLLIKRVKSNDALNLEQYREAYTTHAPYLNISLFKEMHEYLEIYVADIGIGLRKSFLDDPDGKDSEITDENILDIILREGQRSRRKMFRVNRSKYGGLYDIAVMFRGDGDKLGFKGDSRWFFDEQKPKRILDQIPQHTYHGLVHGFAIIGNVSWKKRQADSFPFINELRQVTNKNRQSLFLGDNPWMRQDYRTKVSVQDFRFCMPASEKSTLPIAVLFPSKHLMKEKIDDILADSHLSKAVIIAGIHESEYKKYRTTLESFKLDSNSNLQRAIILTNSLLPHVFVKSRQTFLYSDSETKAYIRAPLLNPKSGLPRSICLSYISFRLWKRVYDSERMWECLSEKNKLAYINTEIQWSDGTLRGYLDFSQLNLIPECRSLCVEQLMGFLMYHDNLYFRSLDRFTDEICEQANHLMDNSVDGATYWIGSIFVSGSSERKLVDEKRDEDNVFYFFKHSDHRAGDNQISSLFEWATRQDKIDHWFPPENYQDHEYSRVGNTSFLAVKGSEYWTAKHYRNWDSVYQIRQAETYDLLQKQFGAHPPVFKMGHFDSVDHHDLFEIKSDSIVDTDIVASQMFHEQGNNSYEFLLTSFLRALVPSFQTDNLSIYFQKDISENCLKSIKHIIHSSAQARMSNEKQGVIVYLTDYQTSKIVETVKPVFADELQQRIIPIIPIEKNYASSTLLTSPLLLDALEEKVTNTRNHNKIKCGSDTVDVTLFIAASFTMRLQEELRHIIKCMGATQIKTLSLLDRQRMPFGRHAGENHTAFTRLDLPAIGFSDTCPICSALNSLYNLQKALRDPDLRQRNNQITMQWKAVKSSDNYFENGIALRYITLPDDVQQSLLRYKGIYDQGNIEITTDLGLVMFSIEHTVISLCSDFLNECIYSEELDPSVKLLLLSAHILTFNDLQLSEKYICQLIEQLCSLLQAQTNISPYTGLAVVALCGQPTRFLKYAQDYLAKAIKNGQVSKNNDALLLRLAIYQKLRNQSSVQPPDSYRRELHCYLRNESNALELIYDLFLYSETKYKQSHRQAFGVIESSRVRQAEEIYYQALKYTQKLIAIYSYDQVKNLFHNTDDYELKKSNILRNLEKLAEDLSNVNNNHAHEKVRESLCHALSEIQSVNKGLYIRTQNVANNTDIINWLTYCIDIAQKRFVRGGDTILKIVSAHNNNAEDFFPRFYAHADVTEEVINLIVDMRKNSSSKLKNFIQPDRECLDKGYDGIIMVEFANCYVKLSFYNATKNRKPIEEISYIKHSKSNRPSMITFHQFEDKLSHSPECDTTLCFSWNYVEETYKDYLEGEKIWDDEHLYCATMIIPYIDQGSSFGS